MKIRMLTALLALLLAAPATGAWAQAPTAIPYSGTLTDGGTPVTGSVPMTFDIYDAASSGTLQWSETQNVDVLNGDFTVELGSTTPLDAATFGASTWLEVTYNGTPLTPRTPLLSVPYAFTADIANTVAANTVTSTEIADGAIVAADVDTNSIQARVTGTCAAWSMVSGVNADGSVTCAPDYDTTYSAGTGLSLIANIFEVNTNVIQKRVTGTCAASSMVSGVNADGSVTCAPDYDTTYFAGTGLDLTAGSFSIGTGGVTGTELAANSVDGTHLAAGAISVPGPAFQRAGVTGCESSVGTSISFVTGSGCWAYAPLHLPDGVQIDSMTCSAIDNSATSGADLTFYLYDLDLTTGAVSTVRGTATSVGTSATPELLTATGTLTTVDNTARTYMIAAFFGTADQGLEPVKLHVNGCSVTYQ